MMDKGREEYIYEVYLFSEPYLMVLEDESITNIEVINQDKIFKVIYKDSFFEWNLKNSGKESFSIIALTFNTTGQFLQQIELSGDDLSISDGSFSFKFDQITNNRAFSSVNPNWETPIEAYKRERVSYLRDVKINTLLK